LPQNRIYIPTDEYFINSVLSTKLPFKCKSMHKFGFSNQQLDVTSQVTSALILPVFQNILTESDPSVDVDCESNDTIDRVIVGFVLSTNKLRGEFTDMDEKVGVSFAGIIGNVSSLLLECKKLKLDIDASQKKSSDLVGHL
jgi:hypothetical protein